MKAFVIAWTNLRRMLRNRANIFFVFVFPMLLILVLGATFGGSSTPKLGVVVARPGPLSNALLHQLERARELQVVREPSASALLPLVEHGNLEGGLEIPASYDTAISSGHTVTVDYLARPGTSAQQFGQTVRAAVAAQASLLGAARFAVTEHAAASFAAGLDLARRSSPSVPLVSVRQSTAGTSVFPTSLSTFDVGAWTQLLLFMFLTALTGSVALIEVRRLGLPRRMLATPTRPITLIAGETLGRMLIGLTQALVIIAGSALLFGVNWGQPLGVAAIVILFDLVAAGFGIFVGTLFRTEQQASGISLLLGLGLAALGGCMVPLELFSPTLRRVAHITPHAWANDAFSKLVGRGASIGGILPQLGVLAVYGAVLLVLASWRLRQVLTATPAA
ncbi:MAG TPA: ABC transporter permease [Streptosporangiaceae bacterium]|nr:ABC transporter permease [Streptosporangiaceae bacterium]